MTEAEAWNAGAAVWLELVRSPDGPARRHDEVLYELFPAPGGLAVDVGCGEGRFTRALAALGFDVLGVDSSSALLDAARGADPGGRYELAAADSLPLADGRRASCSR